MVPNYANNITGFYTRENLVTGAVSNVSLGQTFRTLSLSRGPLIKGKDHRTPHPWNYVSRNRSGVSGVAIRSDSVTGRDNERLEGALNGTSGCFTLPEPALNLYDEALSRLNDRVRGGLDLSIDLLEAGQTHRMLRAFEQWDDFKRHFRSVARRKLLLVRSVGSYVLQYRYGAAPLLQDLYDAADLGTRIIRNHLTRFKAHATRGIPSYASTFQPAYPGTAPRNRVPCQVQILSGKDVVEIGVQLKVRDQDFNIDQWTSLNPISMAWETLPYSFVVDWFVDIGGYLRNLETALLSRNDFVSGYVSTFRRYEACSRVENLVDGRYRWVEQEMSVKETSFTRTVLTSYPLPRHPVFSADLSSGRFLNAAALLSQFLGRRW